MRAQRRIIVHNYLPAQDYAKENANLHIFSAEVDRGQGKGFERQLVFAETPEEAQQRAQSQFGSWAKIRNIKQVK